MAGKRRRSSVGELKSQKISLKIRNWEAVRDLCLKEERSFSQMCDMLIEEALRIHGINGAGASGKSETEDPKLAGLQRQLEMQVPGSSEYIAILSEMKRVSKKYDPSKRPRRDP